MAKGKRAAFLWTGRVIAKGNQTKGPGRKTLHNGERDALSSLCKAIALHGETHPIIEKCMRDLLKIADAEPGYRGRYIGDRFRAIARVLDMLVGKPREAPSHKRDDPKGAVRKLVERLQDEHGPEAAE